MFRRLLMVVSMFVALCAVAGSRGADAVPAKGGTAVLTPENTKIQFVCAHVGPKPDPRKGGFGKFSGKVVVDGRSLKSVSVDIETASLFTEFDMLTTHLKSPDFFEVRRFPTAKFESTKIESGAGGGQITGKLTLHGVTKEISFPAKLEVTDTSVKLTSEFTINRLDFGINYDPKKVEDKVSLTVVIGEKT